MADEARIVRVWDVIVVGAGIIGLSLARELRKTGRTVLVVERREPGREASYAAGGMLVNSGDEGSEALRLWLMPALGCTRSSFSNYRTNQGSISIGDLPTICFPNAGQPPTSGQQNT
jgi:glycine/D-amino acid oxidase-like deaminating enzyme